MPAEQSHDDQGGTSLSHRKTSKSAGSPFVPFRVAFFRRRAIYPSMLRPAYLSRKLTRPLPTKDGGTLRTIGEACDYMTSMGKRREMQTRWQRVCKLILAKENVLTVSRALELALFMDAKLDVSQI
jgi:hypothetical protein